MFYADWISEGIAWWGEQLWYFMRNFPPFDWITSPYYELKVALYITPIIIFYLIPWILYFRARRKAKKLAKPIKIIQNQFTCPHCGFAPPQPPAGGVYYCGKCGKSTTLTSPSDFSLHS